MKFHLHWCKIESTGHHALQFCVRGKPCLQEMSFRALYRLVASKSTGWMIWLKASNGKDVVK